MTAQSLLALTLIFGPGAPLVDDISLVTTQSLMGFVLILGPEAPPADETGLDYLGSIAPLEGEQRRWLWQDGPPRLLILVETASGQVMKTYHVDQTIETQTLSASRKGRKQVYESEDGSRRYILSNKGFLEVFDQGKDRIAKLKPVVPASYDRAGNRIYRAGEIGLELPVFTQKVAPEYPKNAVRSQTRGNVIIEVTLRKNGTMSDIRVVKHFRGPGDGFGEAAIEALRKWEFVPGKVEGKPVDVRMTLKMDFGVI